MRYTTAWMLMACVVLGPTASRAQTRGAGQERVGVIRGQVVDAESLHATGKRALMRLLSLERGNVLAGFAPVERPTTIVESTHALLLESAAFRDRSWAELGLPADDVVVVAGADRQQGLLIAEG